MQLLFRGEVRALAQVEDRLGPRGAQPRDQLRRVLFERVRRRIVPGGTEGLRHRPRVDRQVHVLPDLLLHVLERLEDGGVQDGDARPLRGGGAHAVPIPRRRRAWERISPTRDRYGIPIRSAMIGRSPYPGERPGSGLHSMNWGPRRIQPEVDPGEVAASEGPVDPQGAPLDLREDRARQRGRHPVRDAVLPVPLHLEGVDELRRRDRLRDDLHHPGDPGRIVPQHSHRDLRPRHERFDHRVLAVRPRDEPHHLPRRVEGRRARGDPDPFAGSFEDGFHDDGEGKRQRIELLRGSEGPERRGGEALVFHEALGHRFVEGDAEGQRIGADERDAEHLEDGRDVRLAAPSAFPFRDVEDDVGGCVPRGVDEPAPGGKTADVVAQAGEGVLDVAHRRLGVVLLEGVLGQVIGRVGRLYVVGETDSHRRFLLAIRSFPAGMSARTSPVSRR